MAIMTVTGPISREKLGITLPHEHIFCDLRSLVGEYDEISRRTLFREDLTLANYGHVRRNPYAILDNALIDEEDVQIREVMEWKKAGGDSIVDVTTSDFGRDPELLRGVSYATGMQIVMGCGRYIDASKSTQVREMNVSELADEMITDIIEGAGESGVRAGVIGEIGTSKEIAPSEYRALDASVIAQKQTGVGLHIHACLWNKSGVIAARHVIDQNVDPKKVCINHADAALDRAYIDQLIALGVIVEFDNYGKEFYVDRRNRNLLEGSFATDIERCREVARLIEGGYIDQILITNDICLKSLTHRYGGWGYDHILVNIVPMLRDCGLTEAHIRKILVENPANFLDAPA